MNLISISKKISDLYDKSVRKDLEIISKNIEKELSEHMSTIDNLFKLKSDTNNKKYYDFTYRIKNKDSLYEKLHRKNLIFSLVKQNDFENMEDNSLIDIIKNFDDNIGFRIICDLQEDVKNVFELLKDYEIKFTNFKFLNLHNQPTKMKNGNNIYKINSIYKNIPFELQIKSKLNSAFEDMEHDLYYKNNQINIVKDINKLSFTQISYMLKQIDNYMSELRKTNKNALKEDDYVKNIAILTEIENRYKKELKKAIADDFIFNFEEISEQLIFMVKKENIDSKKPSHINRIIQDILKNNNIRHNSWGIIILEAIYLDSVENDDKIFLDEYLKFILHKINARSTERNVLKYIKLIYKISLKEKLGSEHLLKYNEYKHLSKLINILDTILMNEVEIEKDQINNVYKYFSYKYFNLDISKLNNVPKLEELNNNISYLLEQNSLIWKESADEIKLKLGLK